jgi:uncharacterized protein
LKKILLISDTHGHLDERLVKHISDADEVWHAGDIGSLSICKRISETTVLRAVWGNIDGPDVRGAYPEDNVFTCDSLKVVITHIAGSGNNYPQRVKSLIAENNPGLFICGHSHILKVMFNKELNLLHMNPGAAGIHGFHQVKTALKFEVHNGEIKNLSVIELGKRTSLT